MLRTGRPTVQMLPRTVVGRRRAVRDCICRPIKLLRCHHSAKRLVADAADSKRVSIMIVINQTGFDEGLRTEIEHLQSLVADLQALASGALPTKTALQDSPVIHGYLAAFRPVPCLFGFVDSHPVLGEGRQVTTSEIWLSAPELRWVRTYSRYYRLGLAGTVPGAPN